MYQDQAYTRSERAEDRVMRARALFIAAAGISFLFSVYLWFLVDRDQGLFVGIWVPSILSLGSLVLAAAAARVAHVADTRA